MTNATLNPFDALPIPGYRRIPVVGSRFDILRFFSDPIGHMVKLEREFGSVAAFSADDASLVCVFGADNNRTILSDPTTFNNFLGLPFTVPEGSAATRLFNGILSMNGEHHKRFRRLLMPVVNKSAVSSYIPAIVQMTNDFMDGQDSNPILNIVREMAELTARVSTYCLFGMRSSPLAHSFGQLSLRLLGFLSSPWTIAFPINAPGTYYAGFLETAERLEKNLRQFIRERLREDTSRIDVLSMLVRARDEDDTGLTDDEIISLSTSMLFGGLDPITNTLSWTLVLLSQHPEILAHVQSELDSVLSNADPTEDDLSRLPLLDAIVNESLRLLPAIAHLIFRRPRTATRLGPHILPNAGLIVLSPFVTHRHPELFPNPARFQPERWKHTKPGPYEFMPFGAGPRMCIGAGFAAQVVRVQLATILQRFYPQLPPNVRIDYQVRAANLGAKGPIPMRLLRRDKPIHKSQGAVRGTIHALVDFPHKA